MNCSGGHRIKARSRTSASRARGCVMSSPFLAWMRRPRAQSRSPGSSRRAPWRSRKNVASAAVRRDAAQRAARAAAAVPLPALHGVVLPSGCEPRASGRSDLSRSETVPRLWRQDCFSQSCATRMCTLNAIRAARATTITKCCLRRSFAKKALTRSVEWDSTRSASMSMTTRRWPLGAKFMAFPRRWLASSSARTR